jgi:hypothetical protein
MEEADEPCDPKGQPASDALRWGICADVAGNEDAVLAWFAKWRDQLTYISNDRGCGCCVRVWTVEGSAAARDDLPPGVKMAP